MSYTLVGSVKSRAVRVAWTLEELGLDYAYVAADARSDEAKKYNPSGKIPSLVDGDTALTDSVAIMTYLADKHGALTCPAGTLERAQQDGHTQFICDEMDSVLWTAARHTFVLPEGMRVPQVKESLKWEFARTLTRLEDRLGNGPYLMGETFTVPDMLAAHCLRWAKNAGFPAPSKRLAKYFSGLLARNAFVRATEKT